MPNTFGLPAEGPYHDVYAFIADQHAVQVDLLVDAPCAGLYDKESLVNGTLHLDAGSRLSMPLAAAALLLAEDHPLIRLRPSAIFDDSGVLGSLKTNFTREACCLIDFKSISPVFFEFGFAVANLCQNEDMEDILAKVLIERLRACARLAAQQFENNPAKYESGCSSLVASLSTVENFLQREGLHTLLDANFGGPDRIYNVFATELEAALNDDHAAIVGLDAQQVAAFRNHLTLPESKVFKCRQKRLGNTQRL